MPTVTTSVPEAPPSCRAWRRPPARAFTLVELMVVVLILATLVALLLPAIGSVRESSRSVTCAANLRQIGMGLTAYMNDEDSAPWGLSDHTEWCRDLAAYLEVQLPSRVFSCPTARDGLAAASHFSGHPEFLPWIWATGTVIPGTVRDLRPDLAIIYDGTQYSLGGSSAYPIAWGLPPAYVWRGASDDEMPAALGDPFDGFASYNIRFRHRARATHLFGDGHVAAAASTTLTNGSYRMERGSRRFPWE